MSHETTLIVFGALSISLVLAVQVNSLLRHFFGDTVRSRLRDSLIYFFIFLAASCVGSQFGFLSPDTGAKVWVSSLLVFLGTKAFPALSLFTFACILFLLVKSVLRPEEYEKLGDYPIPEE